ncbi:MAG: PQQ-dependent sugar dehydrogenase [Chloroflexota bacterium]|nr:PQQ-dependent sugar dehydrogenase [Chloroflexota bacterium]
MPPPDTAFAAIGAGAEHSCGLTLRGDLLCWGNNDDGRADSPGGPFSALAVGIAHTCVLRDQGHAYCQGANEARQADAPDAEFKSVSAGLDHTCATLPQGRVECWGRAEREPINVHLAVPHGPFTSVDAGWHTTCAIDLQGAVQCWNHSYVATPTPPYDRLTFVNALPGRIFSNPTEIFQWPYGGLAVADRQGFISIYTQTSAKQDILSMIDSIASDGSINGLLSAAIDPEFTQFPFLYIYYTIRSDAEVGLKEKGKESARLSRFRIEDGRIDHKSELIIVEIAVNPRPTEGYDGANHYGGAIRFGPDGMLYLGFGDGTCFECPQRLDSLLGKIIRIDVRGASVDQPYQIPKDNPMLGVPDARPEIWAYGLRNPWRMAFDRHDGSLWVADVGQDAEEEVSIANAGSNLGWPIYEGSACLNFNDEVSRFYGIANGYPCTGSEEVTAPIDSYRIRSATCAVIGGVVYRGAEIPSIDGAYLFGDFCSGQVWVLEGSVDTGWRKIQIADLDLPLSSFGTDAAGEVYVLTFGGPILRLVETDSGDLPSVTITPGETVVPTVPGST